MEVSMDIPTTLKRFSETEVGRTVLVAKPERGDYINHNNVLYYVHRVTIVSGINRNRSISGTGLMEVYVTEA
jgi:hypothetical protein